MAGSYAYPDIAGDPDGQGVLKNRFDIRSAAGLREAEYALAALRQQELFEGRGPKGAFDAEHLKAIHHHIFQDVYEWAGSMRHERPFVDGERVEPVGLLSKGDNGFLHGSRIERGLAAALSPIADPVRLRGSSLETFASSAGQILGELNFVHPFREGNGRTQEAFVQQLGAYAGHTVDFTIITKPRMLEASIATFDDPRAPAMVHLMLDAIDPGRRAALRSAFAELRARGENPMEHDVRTARIGQEVTGAVIGFNDRTATLMTDTGVVAVPRRDFVAETPASGQAITVQVHSQFEHPVDMVERRLGPAACFIKPVASWPFTVDQSVERTLEAHPSVSSFLHDAQLHAGHIWKDPEPVIARLQGEVERSPATMFATLAALSHDPHSYGALLGRRSFSSRPDEDRQNAIDRLPLFTSSIAHFFETKQRLEPSIRRAEVEWRAQMGRPMPSLSREAQAVVNDLARAHQLKGRDKEPAHLLAADALRRTEAWSEITDWRRTIETRLAVPNAIERIPGLSDEKRSEIKSTLSLVDTAVREAHLTKGREQTQTRNRDRTFGRGQDSGLGY